jgi:D-serine deaminase-like pyridoxal phosphate-dependent protein
MSQGAPYFTALNKALHKAGLAAPVLVIDKARLNRNIDRLKKMLPRGMAYRIVAKSLPGTALLTHIAKRARTDRLMSFNALMVRQLFDAMPQADQLLGKPLPVAAAADLFKTLSAQKGKKAAQNVQFLVDTPKRLADYEALAVKLNLPLRINLEIDIGLHRGGLEPGVDLAHCLRMVDESRHLNLSGLMGYEPHLSKLPKLGGWRRRAQKGAQTIYGAALAQVEAQFGAAHAKAMVRNMAGSPTFGLYGDTRLANELAAGSALVKPSDFDLALLAAFEAAVFIATPALKVSQGVRLPGLEFAHGLLGTPQSGTSVFIHGGYWMAAPVYPSGLKNSTVFGRSSNQEMLVGRKGLKLAVDDFVFLRPTQSEAIFLQFPQWVVYDKGRIGDIWHPLPVSV